MCTPIYMLPTTTDQVLKERMYRPGQWKLRRWRKRWVWGRVPISCLSKVSPSRHGTTITGRLTLLAVASWAVFHAGTRFQGLQFLCLIPIHYPPSLLLFRNLSARWPAWSCGRWLVTREARPETRMEGETTHFHCARVHCPCNAGNEQ